MTHCLTFGSSFAFSIRLGALSDSFLVEYDLWKKGVLFGNCAARSSWRRYLMHLEDDCAILIPLDIANICKVFWGFTESM